MSKSKAFLFQKVENHIEIDWGSPNFLLLPIPTLNVALNVTLGGKMYLEHHHYVICLGNGDFSGGGEGEAEDTINSDKQNT